MEREFYLSNRKVIVKSIIWSVLATASIALLSWFAANNFSAAFVIFTSIIWASIFLSPVLEFIVKIKELNNPILIISNIGIYYINSDPRVIEWKDIESISFVNEKLLYIRRMRLIYVTLKEKKQEKYNIKQWGFAQKLIPFLPGILRNRQIPIILDSDLHDEFAVILGVMASYTDQFSILLEGCEGQP